MSATKRSISMMPKADKNTLASLPRNDRASVTSSIRDGLTHSGLSIRKRSSTAGGASDQEAGFPTKDGA